MSKGLLLQLLHLQLHMLGRTHEFEPWLTSWDLRASPQSQRFQPDGPGLPQAVR